MIIWVKFRLCNSSGIPNKSSVSKFGSDSWVTLLNLQRLQTIPRRTCHTDLGLYHDGGPKTLWRALWQLHSLSSIQVDPQRHSLLSSGNDSRTPSHCVICIFSGIISYEGHFWHLMNISLIISFSLEILRRSNTSGPALIVSLNVDIVHACNILMLSAQY